MNDGSIEAYKEYIISVTPLNGYGWGDRTNKLAFTGQYLSGSVTNLSVSSTFPQAPLLIKWSPPQSPNGEIVQYVILVLHSNNSQCLLSMSINCTGCMNNISVPEWPDKSRIGCNEINGTTFNSTNSSLAIVMNDRRIEVYKEYIISVTPLNDYGWGNMTIISVTTGQYRSGPVSNLSVSSTFPQTPLSIKWSPPQTPNGEIVQYAILVLHSNNNQCLLAMSINCRGCVNNISVPEWPDKSRIRCQEMNGTFEATNSSLGLVVNDRSIEAYKEYIITVTPLNGYGWGDMVNTSRTTGQYVSGPVANLSVSSTFPQTPLSIKWSPPQTPYGEIVQYVILVLHPNNNTCLLSMSVNCTGCVNNISVYAWPDKSRNGCKEISGTRFNATNSSFSIVINDGSIEAYKGYIISVTPLNGYGWGNMTNTLAITGDNLSGPVSNLSVSSTFPQTPLLIKWSSPQTPNGEIVQYVILVLHSNNSQCLLSVSINCRGCVNNISAPEWPDKNIICPKQINGTTFNATNSSFSIIMNDGSIEAYKEYIISVTPLNGYGWGNVTNTSVLTGQNRSSPVTNLSGNSSFPTDNLLIMWDVPNKPNGVIMQYLILVSRYNSCLVSALWDCFNCYNASIGHVDSKNVTCNTIANKSSFLMGVKRFTWNITNIQIQPQADYNITIIPINGYGWGTENTALITTPNYVPDVVTNLVSKVNGSCISMTWTAPNRKPLNFTYFIQLMNTTSSTNYTADKDRIGYSLPCLEYCSRYRMCVRMNNNYRNSNDTCISSTTDPAPAAIDGIFPTTDGNNIALRWTYSNFSNCNIMFTVTSNGASYNTSVPYYTLSGLNYFTNYTIEVIPLTFMVFPNLTRRGVGKSVMVPTPQGIPGPVINFVCANVSFSAIRCSWDPPQLTNGIILSYVISYTANLSNNYSINISSGDRSWNLSTGVDTDILYMFRIYGQTIAGSGAISYSSVKIISSIIPYITNEAGIHLVMGSYSGPAMNDQTQLGITLPYSHFSNAHGEIQKFTVVISRTNYLLSIEFSPSNYFNKDYSSCAKDRCDTYEVQLPPPGGGGRRKRGVSFSSGNEPFIIGSDANCNRKNGYFCNGPLTPNIAYRIGFRSYTKRGFYTVGNITKTTKPDLIIPIVLGVLVPAFLLSVIVGAYFYVRYQRNRNHHPTEISPGTDSTSTASLAFIDNKSPAVFEFQAHFEHMQKDSNGRMIDDFQDIRDNAKMLEDQRRLIFAEGNDMKNRYNNIKPYKHNRVKLLCQNDYINASRICVRHWHMDIEKQCDCTDIYIATQGPLGDSKESKVSTMGDFWRMIFENNVDVIVNLTRCEENGREKCGQYWPGDVGEKITYRSSGEAIDVVLQRSNDNSIFTERALQISMRGIERSVTQIHMIAWLDHGCPKSSEFLLFYASYQKARVPNSTVVVHCSAGVGRTGTFILIDEELSRISRQNDKVEIFNNLLKLRKCRCQMVQSESQYCFIYTIVHDYLIQKGLIKLSKAGDHSDSSDLCRQSYENPIFMEPE